MSFFCWQKYFTAAIILVVVCAPLISFAAGGIGFIDRNIWFNTETFFAGETVRVYTALLNTGTKDAYGKIEFFINSESIGTADFVVQRGGNVVTVWKDFVAPYGEITVGVRARKIILTAPGLPDEEIFLDDVGFTTSYFVDRDSDGDGIGDRDDADDDNDGISDEEEERLGTDPFDPDDVLRDAPDSPGASSGSAAAAALSTARDTVAALDEKIRELSEKLAETLRTHKDRVDLEHGASTHAGEPEAPEQLLDIGFSVEAGEPRDPAWRSTLHSVYVVALTVAIWMLEHRLSRLLLLILFIYLIWRFFVRYGRRGV